MATAIIPGKLLFLHENWHTLFTMYQFEINREKFSNVIIFDDVRKKIKNCKFFEKTRVFLNIFERKEILKFCFQILKEKAVV